MALISVQFDDVTYDETDHLQYGIQILKGNSSRAVAGRDFNTTMPVTALNALPRAMQQLFRPGLHKMDWGESDVKSGRYLSIALTLLLLAYLYRFAHALAGPMAGCWTLLLAALDPNLLAHSRLVTTDLYATLGFVMTFYHAFQWLVRGQKKHFYYWCLAIALAQCCKVNNILLYVFCLPILIAYYPSWKTPGKKWDVLQKFLVFVLIQLVVINLFFLFRHTGLSLQQHHFKSTVFQHLQQGWWAKLPLPLPEPFIDTFDLVQYERENATGAAANYLLGELRFHKGFPAYYFVCWLFKTPVLTQVWLLISLVAWLLMQAYRRFTVLFFIVPAGTLLWFLNSSSVQSGYRYLLPVLCLALVLTGAATGPYLPRLGKLKWIVYLLPLAVLLQSFPNVIAYTNELIGDKKLAYQYLADSNIDWGQRQKKVQQFMARHPDYIFEPAQPVTGTLVVGVNTLTGINPPDRFAWLRNHYTPVGTFNDCYLIFEVKP